MNREELVKRMYDSSESIDEYISIAEQYAESKIAELKAENEKLKNTEELLKMTLEVSEFKTAEINRLREFAKLSKKNIDDWISTCPELYGVEDLEVLEAYEKLKI